MTDPARTLDESGRYFARYGYSKTHVPRVEWCAGAPSIPGAYWLAKRPRDATDSSLRVQPGALAVPVGCDRDETRLAWIPLSLFGLLQALWWAEYQDLYEVVAHAALREPTPPTPRARLVSEEEMRRREAELARILGPSRGALT